MTLWGLARIEVIAAKEDIESELRCGVPMKQIHDALLKSGRVTVTYNSFRRQLQPIRDKLKMMSGDINSVHVKNTTQSSIAQDSKQTTQPKTDSKPLVGFQFDPSCKADDFF
ncbi:MAG: hypothetical protein COB46_07750 [Rhodospirillaceae bacterium]|nr:hypothetical protein [Colwellia sp.]PCI39978.1 MAG: hypothetical protein COB46_07750 [Rhodospirillaceae bacterium]